MAERDQLDPANIPIAYANAIRLGVSFSDIRIFFGEHVPDALPNSQQATSVQQQSRIVDRVCIVLTPETVPALVEGLAKAVESYESIFGPLRKVPKGPLTMPAGIATVVADKG